MDILEILFPRTCLKCKKKGKYICGNCFSELTPVRQICPVCQKPSIDGFTHPKCLKPQSLNGLITLWPYEKIIRRAIISLKYKFVREISDEISVLVLEKIKDSFLFQKREIILTTIPLFWTRKNFRGYNQVDGVSKVLAKSYNMRFYPDILIRKRKRSPQVSLSKEERAKNVLGVFNLNSKYHLMVKGFSFIIIDDVFTTGSTLREAAKVLKRSGAKNVWGLTIAR